MPDQIEPKIRHATEKDESRRQQKESDRVERETNESDEEEAVREASHLSAKLVYQVVRREGDEELRRPRKSLFWSGIAAGVCISFSVIGEALFKTYLPDSTGCRCWKALAIPSAS